MGSLHGKVAVITGAARGMGLATASRLAQDGATVYRLDRAPAPPINTPEDSSFYLATDVSDEASVQASANYIKTAHGQVDYLVNIAGINQLQRIADTTPESWDRMMAVNVTGMFLMMKHIVPLMPNGAAIVNMASVSAYVGSDGYAAYVTTKGAVISLTQSVALEFAAHGIRVNAVAPGWVATQFTQDGIALADDPDALRAAANKAHVLNRIAQPEEVANAIAFLLSDRASFITGETLFVDGGFMVKR
jgi:NAD(P)-dependent dehydrogenase (short-subunit alcohol dehydrogenase family)